MACRGYTRNAAHNFFDKQTTAKGKMVRLLNIYGNITGTRFKVELSIESNALQLFDIYFYQEKG
jgi:hypothetical protein